MLQKYPLIRSEECFLDDYSMNKIRQGLNEKKCIFATFIILCNEKTPSVDHRLVALHYFSEGGVLAYSYGQHPD
jgi:hypothetical protein